MRVLQEGSKAMTTNIKCTCLKCPACDTPMKVSPLCPDIAAHTSEMDAHQACDHRTVWVRIAEQPTKQELDQYAAVSSNPFTEAYKQRAARWAQDLAKPPSPCTCGSYRTKYMGQGQMQCADCERPKP